jgi:L-lactate dehydrogenase complex protein LldE
MEVELFIPCFIDQLFPETGFQTQRLLEKAGCTVFYNPRQTCCGQPACNAGFWSESRVVAEKFIRDYTGERPVVAPSASCVGFVRNTLEKVLEESPLRGEYRGLRHQVYELSEFLVDVLGVDDFGASLPLRATYHDSCGALRECGIKTAPRRLLNNVQGLELVEMADVETCCGFGGTFAVKFEPISTGMADQKLANAAAAQAEVIISTDLSCLMHLQGYAGRQQQPIRTLHLAEVLTSGW